MIVYEVLYDTDAPSPAADGTVIYRTSDRAAAERWAASHTCYGRPCGAPTKSDVPARLARRWGLA